MEDYRKGAFNLIAPEGMPNFFSKTVSPETHTLLAQTDESGAFLSSVVVRKDLEYVFVPGPDKTFQLWEVKP